MLDEDHFYEVPDMTECTFEDTAIGTRKVLKIPDPIVFDRAGQPVRCNAIDMKTGNLIFVSPSRMVRFNAPVRSSS